MPPPPVRVLHLCAGNLYGGVERIVAECARSRALCPSMQPLFAVCFDGRLARELESAGVRCARLGAIRFSRPQTLWRARRALARLLADEQPTAVICHSSWMFAVAAPVVRNTAAQLSLWLHDRVSGRPWAERWARLTPPDLIVCNSRFTAATAPHVFDGVACEVVYAPVDAGPPLAASDRAALRRSLQARDDEIVIVMASRFEEWKGHRMLLDAAAGLDGAWRIWIAGGAQRPHEAAYRESLLAQMTSAALQERVIFLGDRDDVPSLMRAADLHCQPNSGAEPFGLAFVEALYAGVPVVTTAMGGACEILTDDCGILVPPGDVQALRSTLARLIADAAVRRALGAAGPARARALCDPARQLARLGQLIESRLIAHA